MPTIRFSERIYVASTREGESGAGLAEDLARRIEDEIAALALTPGVTLGSLRELSERYRVGRSVAREAVGILERRGLGRMRPGPSGGFIIARPLPAALGAQLSSYFRATGLSQRQLRDARDVVDLLGPPFASEPVLKLLSECVQRLEAEACSGVAPCTREWLPARSGGGTLAAEIAQRLATEIAASRGAGARLGSEWDLCERFGVSRLTLRQAIRLLQDSGLIECRRGRGNGLVIRDRRLTGSIRLVLAYLISERLDAMAAGTVLLQINSYVPALAVSRASVEQRRQLDALLARLESRETFERYELLCLVHCIARMADSPIIDLFSRCLAAYEARFTPTLAEWLPAAAQESYFRLLRCLLDEVQPGDDASLERAMRESAACMLEMSRLRPI